jgi:hypothetical protein
MNDQTLNDPIFYVYPAKGQDGFVEYFLKIGVASYFSILVALLFSFCACPAAWADELTVVSVQSNFPDVRIQLQALVNTFGFHTVNYFCIITYGLPKGDDEWTPIVYWPTQNKLIEWGVGSTLITGSDHYFDLSRDVIPDGEVTNDYWHRSDVDRVVKDCGARGDKFTINKTRGGWVSIGRYSQFATVKAQLQYLVNHNDLSNNNALPKTNKFCVIGQKDGTFLGAYVYWETADQLIFWYPDPDDDQLAVTYSDVQIDLKHGLRNQEDAEDDRNEMQRSYAESIVKVCQASGQTFIVNRT